MPQTNNPTWTLFDAGRERDLRSGYLQNAATNERFYRGDQWKTPAGNRIAKQGPRNRRTALLTGKPCLKNSGQMVVFPVCRDGTTALQHQHNGCAGSVDSLHQLQLTTG